MANRTLALGLYVLTRPGTHDLLRAIGTWEHFKVLPALLQIPSTPCLQYRISRAELGVSASHGKSLGYSHVFLVMSAFSVLTGFNMFRNISLMAIGACLF